MRSSTPFFKRLGLAAVCVTVLLFAAQGNRKIMLSQDGCEEECCVAVPKSVGRNKPSPDGTTCKCPGGMHMVGDSPLCVAPSRKFNPKNVERHGCSCELDEDKCSEAVPNSVKRESSHWSAKCKCSKGDELVGESAVCRSSPRQFNPDTLRDHECSCMAREAADTHQETTISGAAYQTWDWMGSLKNDSLLNDITIPGTHDTMAYEFMQGILTTRKTTSDLTGMTLTHEDHLKLQLERGIRWLDVRIGLQGDAVVTCHGPFQMKCDFQCMLDVVSNFLSLHPSEAVFVMLKPECGEKGTLLTQQVLSVLQSSDFIHQGTELSADMTVQAVRGHIVIVNTQTWDELPGFEKLATESNIGFLPIAGSLTGSSQDVQNDYKLGLTVGRKDKVKSVTEFLLYCANDDFSAAGSIKVNYFSASGVGYDVMNTAFVVNTEVARVLREGLRMDRGYAFGACLLDGLPTAGPVVELIGMLIDRNFRRLKDVRVWNADKLNRNRLMANRGRILEHYRTEAKKSNLATLPDSQIKEG